MYTKEDLEKLPVAELFTIAKDMGVTVSQDDQLDTVVYAILDKIAEDTAQGATKRKRSRITKKDTDKVYTVTGSEGENLDSGAPKKRRTKKQSLEAAIAEQAAQEKAESAANGGADADGCFE